ncbi:MAG: NAD-dependent deacylase [Synergistota bacterium]|nr:NAD-dependent deacylase [Synergistota bacterium]
MPLSKIAGYLKKGEVAVLTGAGMSTASGLPDFRGKAGLWKNRDPRVLASLTSMENSPDEFYEFYRSRINALEGVKPNRGHYILSEWRHRGLLEGLVTQNVDGLHQEAGSSEVWELHGNLKEVRCARCRKAYESSLMMKQRECPGCSGPLRPNVVLFGEQLPGRPLEEAERLATSAGCFLVLGSSLEVSPANWFPSLARRSGADLFIVNRTPTPLDGVATGAVHDDIVDVLEQIDGMLESI